ncbi:MAG: glycosyltransferase [Alphaproteobacteria bacterium]|nr:glycosyltransferase [Alphaproteobacteria bacterium]
MKVLIISDAWHPQVNGVVRTYESLTKALRRKGLVTDVIGPANFAVNIPMPFYPEIKLVIRPYRRLKQLIEDFNPDKIHIATEGPLGWAARRYCMKNNLEFTTCYHTQFPDYIAKRFAWLIPPLYNIVHRKAVKAVRKFHAPSKTLMVASKSLEKQLLDWNFSSPIKQLSRGVDHKIFHLDNSEDIEVFSDDIKRPISLYVGRIAIEKNLEDFLDMPWDGTKVIVGDGPMRFSLEKKYPDVLFVGKKAKKELASYYRASDVFVFPSKTDTFGIVLIEALACGLPIAAYNVMGPKDILLEPSLGVLTDDDLSAASYEALKLASPKKRCEYVQKNYSWESAAEQFLDAL